MTNVLSIIASILIIAAICVAIVAFSYFVCGNLLHKLSKRNTYINVDGKKIETEKINSSILLKKESLPEPNLNNLNALLLVMESLDTLVMASDVSSFLDNNKKENSKTNVCRDL